VNGQQADEVINLTAEAICFHGSTSKLNN